AATVSRVGRPPLVTAPLLLGGCSSCGTGQAHHHRRATRNISMIDRIRSQNRIRAREAGSRMPVKYFGTNLLTGRSRGPSVLLKWEFRNSTETSRLGRGDALPSLKLGRHAPKMWCSP